MSGELQELAGRCGAAAEVGIGYLLKRYDGGGFYKNVAGDLVAHYKSPYVLWRLGAEDKAAAVLGHILGEFLDEDGDLQRNGPCTRNPVYADNLHHYMNSWVVRGAAALGTRDAGEKMLGYLKTQQDGQTGGVFTRRGAKSADVGSTAAVGMAACDMGDMDVASGAGRFLLSALDSQPGGEDFYLRFRGAAPVREFPEDTAGFHVIRAGVRNQAYWFPGFAMAFLCRLAVDAGEDAYTAGARGYLAVVANCADDKYSTLASGKLGWGMGALYRRSQRRRRTAGSGGGRRRKPALAADGGR